MDSSRNIWAPGLCDLDPMSSKNRRSYTNSNSHGWIRSERMNYESPSYASGWSTPLSNAKTQEFSQILGLHEDESFYWQVPMKSTAGRDDIKHCSCYMDINESGSQICDNFEDDFDEIKEMLDGRKGWGDYFDDGDLADGSEFSDGDPCHFDSCSDDSDFYHSQEFSCSETDEIAFQDCEIDFYHSGEVESSDELGFADCQSGTEDDEAPLEFIMMTETDELSFADCQTGTEADEALMAIREIFEIDFYHSQDIENSETDELGFHDCETGTEDDEEVMVMHEI